MLKPLAKVRPRMSDTAHPYDPALTRAPVRAIAERMLHEWVHQRQVASEYRATRLKVLTTVLDLLASGELVGTDIELIWTHWTREPWPWRAPYRKRVWPKTDCLVDTEAVLCHARACAAVGRTFELNHACQQNETARMKLAKIEPELAELRWAYSEMEMQRAAAYVNLTDVEFERALVDDRKAQRARAEASIAAVLTELESDGVQPHDAMWSSVVSNPAAGAFLDLLVHAGRDELEQEQVGQWSRPVKERAIGLVLGWLETGDLTPDELEMVVSSWRDAWVVERDGDESGFGDLGDLGNVALEPLETRDGCVSVKGLRDRIRYAIEIVGAEYIRGDPEHGAERAKRFTEALGFAFMDPPPRGTP